MPSQTELLFDLGLGERIIGVTKFCVHPKDKCSSKEKIGGTKKINIDKIKALNPDLILANKEENDKEQIESLSHDFPVWISDIKNLHDAYAMIKSVGMLTGTGMKADELISKISLAFKNIDKLPPIQVLYLIWKKPFMAAGSDTFINSMINNVGFVNVIQEPRYPEVKKEDFFGADLVILSSEPYPFGEKHKEELEKKFPSIKFMLVDGEMFSWYGSRLRLFPDYVNSKFTDLRSSQK